MVQTIFVLRIFINLHQRMNQRKKQGEFGMMEDWSVGLSNIAFDRITPLFHHSCTPVFYIPEPVRFKRGSRRSRSASPRRLMPRTVTKMQRPGKSGSHQAVLM